MSWTIRRRLALLVIIGCTGVLVASGAAWWTGRRQVQLLQAMEEATGALRVQQDMDMMHDAIRADVMAVRLAGDDATELAASRASLDEHAEGMRGHIAALLAMRLDGPAGAAIAGVEAAVLGYVQLAAEVVALPPERRNDPERGLPAFAARFTELETALEGVSTAIEARIASAKDAAGRFARTALLVQLLASVGAILVAGVTGTLVAASITRPLERMRQAMRRVAAGDLTAEAGIAARDEIGAMAGDLDATVRSLHQVVTDIRAAADQAAASGEELSATAQTISAGAQHQATTVAAIDASVARLSRSIGEVAGNAADAERTATSTSDSAAEGARIVERSVAGMQAISDSSRRIATIIGVIDQIAAQTNLLALNAAIEAASAGEHGLGFAVVADEVRKLAERARAAAHEISELIGESGARVDEGAALSKEVGGALDAIVAGITATRDGMAGIRASTEAQSGAATEVAGGVAGISSITKENSATAAQMAASAEELSAQALRLQELVARFRLH